MAFDGFTVLESSALAPRPEARLATLHHETGVLTHDLNNLLNVILAASEALAQGLPAGSDGHDLAQVSQDAAERAAELVRRLLELSEPAAERTGVCDAADALACTARLAALSTPADVTVTCEGVDLPLTCAVDRCALESALLNLCINAGHAMPTGGALFLSAAVVGDDIVLGVRDTGCGMSPAVLARATEPYFTTRRGQGGTGLGLAGVRAFAVRSHGRFELASREGQGVTATLVLPRG